jgi:multicomponent Na+:H+ antiporter subunit E
MRGEILTFIILFILWIILSGMFDAFHLSLGLISCLIVTLISGDLIFKKEKITKNHLITGLRFMSYIPWLLYEIVLSNIHVAYLVLHLKMPIEPLVLHYKSNLKKDISKAVFAHSIILTPGTITMDITKDNVFIVHCISQKVAEDLLTGEMERKVAYVFGENIKRSN